MRTNRVECGPEAPAAAAWSPLNAVALRNLEDIVLSRPTRVLPLVPIVGVLAIATAALASPGGLSRAVEAGSLAEMSCGSSEVELIGFSEVLDKTTFGDFTVSELSGLVYDQRAGRFLAVADRSGPVLSHVFEIEIDVTDLAGNPPAVTDVAVLSDAAGVSYNGFNFDGEGIVMDRDGEGFYVSSESGSAAGQQPEIRRFTENGQEIESLEVPSRFLIGSNNVMFESLGISPNGKSLFTATERHLAADGTTADLRSRERILRYEHDGDGFVPAEEYFYLTEPGRTPSDLGVVEVIAISEEQLLILERGFVASEGNTVKVFRVKLQGAEDVSGVSSLASTNVEPVEKELLFDLAACPDDGATVPPGAVKPNALLDNFEAMAFGPDLPGDRRSLVLVSDDNEGSNQTTRVVVLSIR
jgi:hypothetical protein